MPCCLPRGGRSGGENVSEDLVHRPENGWSLYGLAQSLKAQNRGSEAAAKIEERFEKAWKTADVKLAKR